jgi:hypothetical protein
MLGEIIKELDDGYSTNDFDEIKMLTQSKDPLEREIGAHILGNYTVFFKSKRSFQAESIVILTALLNDKNEHVITSTAFSLGYLGDPSCIKNLMKLIDHKNPEIRRGIVSGLSCHNDNLAVSGLIKLSSDKDFETRNWATFGLARQCKIDTKELRKALFDRLLEDNNEIRGEALMGLAERKDPNIKAALTKELSGPFYGNGAIEAAKLTQDPYYYPLLQKLRKRLDGNAEENFINNIDEAMEACKAK